MKQKRGLKPTIFFTKNRRGQIWVETVIYTLIAFLMIGLVLGVAKPKIEELQDKAIIEQSVEMLKELDSTIMTMGGPGNKRIIELRIKKGSLKIKGVEEKIVFEMKSKYTFSEPYGVGEPEKVINDGNIEIRTEKQGRDNIVTLTRDYSSDYNILYNEKDEEKAITQASIAYDIVISNKGIPVGDTLVQINFEIS